MTRLFDTLVEKFGFAPADDDAICREWSQEVDVLWVGKQTETYKVAVSPYGSDSVFVSYAHDGRVAKQKIYSFGDARTLNAIKATVSCAGFEF